MRSPQASGSSGSRYAIYTDSLDTPVPDLVEVRPATNNQHPYPESPFAARLDKFSAFVNSELYSSEVLFLDPDTAVFRNELDTMPFLTTERIGQKTLYGFGAEMTRLISQALLSRSDFPLVIFRSTEGLLGVRQIQRVYCLLNATALFWLVLHSRSGQLALT